jgi:hypothetical protein
MKIELKSLKVAHHLSQESQAFTATIWIDGKRVGWAENRGCGDPVNYGWDIELPGHRQTGLDFEAWIESLPPEPVKEGAEAWQVEMGPMKITGDYFFALLVEQMIDIKFLKGKSRKAVLFKLVDDEGESYRTISTARHTRDDVEQHIRSKYAGQIDIIVTQDGIEEKETVTAR